MGISAGQNDKRVIDYSNIKVIWFDELINDDYNQECFKHLKSIFKNIKGYQSLDEGFENFYKAYIEKENENENEFEVIFVIISGKLFGRYIEKLKVNINKIINIPYTFIFTSLYFKEILLNKSPDREHILSYDTMISVNDGFYNPGGVFDDFDELLYEMKLIFKKLDQKIKTERRREKIDYNYEGVLTFEYLKKEEDLLAPTLYKDIITNEKITEENCKKFYNYILSFNEGELNYLIKNLGLFKYIPFEILSKYWARFYTIESDFYKDLNNKLMKSELKDYFKTYINMLYTGVKINSLNSSSGHLLYRGSLINKIEIDKIKKYQNLENFSKVVVFSKAFLSFSEIEKEAEKYCIGADNSKVECLFILENNSIHSHESNANIQNFSSFPSEKEVLFFPGSSFIIKNIEEDNNKIKIKLNYNGKFKEEYNLIYQDEEKLNNLINTNEMTKNIAGKKLCFLKNGKYLKGEIIYNNTFCKIYKGKDLETDETVSIKQMNKENININKCKEEVKIIKKISEKINYSCKFKDYFETEEYIYTILTYYDDNLENYFINNKNKLSPNLIKKIFKQLNLVFRELLNNHLAHRNIMPSNILIKYSNEKRTSFDSVLTDYGICKEYGEDNLLYGSIFGNLNYAAPEIFTGKEYKNNCDLFSIGVTIYYLYFGKLPFNRKSITDKINMNIRLDEDKQLEDLLIKLLKENPDERITWEEYFKHPFFKQYAY